MAMDFFESQDVARRKTGRLVVLFVAAVLAIVVLTYLVVAGALIAAGAYGESSRGPNWSLLAEPRLLLAVGTATILLVAGGSLSKLWQLRAGGAAVAESVGGQLLDTAATDLAERRLLNVVEEMAIASGTPVPPVYLMEEAGINAFAAGFAPSDAVIGVTRGCVERLSRDELQGVIAHEFSHVLNGDMRLNIRLMGILHGILLIGVLGSFLLRMSFFTGAAYRRSSRDRGGGAGAILAIGGGLMIVGFAGTFFGNWIKAAVSRQREYLADASAVQFTRNPTGIAGALRKIGGFVTGARLEHPNAAQASHMFFGRGLTSGLNAVFSTHPPLPERIRRIDPSWDGKFLASASTPGRAAAGAGAVAFAGGARAIAAPRAGRAAPAAGPAPAAPADSLVDRIGRPSPAHVEYARDLLGKMPPELAAASHEPFGARGIILGLLFDKDPSARNRQIDRVRRFGDSGVQRELQRLLPTLEGLDARLRLPLIDTSIPALTAMSRGQYDRFRETVVELCRADERLDLFEWCLQRIVLGELDLKFGRARRRRTQYYAMTRLGPDCRQLLSILAHAGHRDGDAARRSFAEAAGRLPGLDLTLLSRGECGLRQLDTALDRLALAAPRLKRDVIRACATCVAADRTVTVNEAELLRAVAGVLGCPMPPLLPGQPVVDRGPAAAGEPAASAVSTPSSVTRR